MPPPHADVIAGAAPSRRPRRSSTVIAAVVGLAVGAVLGSVLTTALRTEDPGPVRVLAELGVPRESLGEVVVPVRVVNAGGSSFLVQGLQAADAAGITFALVGDDVPVPPGELREPLVRVRRDCAAAARPPLDDVQLDVVVRARDDVTTGDVRVPVASARLLGFLLSCEGP